MKVGKDDFAFLLDDSEDLFDSEVVELSATCHLGASRGAILRHSSRCKKRSSSSSCESYMGGNGSNMGE